MEVLVASFGFGLVTAAVLAISTVGFTMQFGITDILNLAYGALLIAGAYVTYALNQIGVSVWVGLLASGLVGALLSLLLYQVVYGPFQARHATRVTMIIVTLAMAIIITNLTLAVVGPDNVSYAMDSGPMLRVGSLELTAAQLGIIAVSIVVMAAIHGLLTFTRLGKAMRATACNRNLARSCGIRTQQVIRMTWLTSGALCGIGGTVFAMDAGSFGATSGTLFIVVILAAAVLGGVGRPYGAMLGAVLIGITTEVSAAIISPDYKTVVAFVVLLLMMVYRPQGLLVRESAG